jgi:nitric oxide reductase NorQ protein
MPDINVGGRWSARRRFSRISLVSHFPWSGPVTRPGGQVYRPRVLAGLADVEALRTLRAEGVPSLLSGPPGTGKTSLVEAAFPDLITVVGDGDTTRL